MQHLNNTERTQYAHRTHTHKQTYMQHIHLNREQNIEDTHIEQHTEQHTEQTQYPDTSTTQNNTLVHTLFTHIVLILLFKSIYRKTI